MVGAEYRTDPHGVYPMADRPASSPEDAAPALPGIGGAAAAARAPVLLPLPLQGAYDYKVPAEIPVRPGDFVLVPLGRRQDIGVVWDEAKILDYFPFGD